MVTNGDNMYDAAFLETLATVPAEADIAAFSFYSRYQRPSGKQQALTKL